MNAPLRQAREAMDAAARAYSAALDWMNEAPKCSIERKRREAVVDALARANDLARDACFDMEGLRWCARTR